MEVSRYAPPYCLSSSLACSVLLLPALPSLLVMACGQAHKAGVSAFGVHLRGDLHRKEGTNKGRRTSVRHQQALSTLRCPLLRV